MERSRQKALEMKDKLVQDFQEIRNNLPDDLYKDRHKERHVKQPNGTYKITREMGSCAPPWVSDPCGEEWLQQAGAFLGYLHNNITGPESSLEEIYDEVFIILKTVDKNYEPATVDRTTCSKEAFVIALVRDCLKDEKIPLVFSNKWKEFANNYTRYLMGSV